MQPAEDFLRDYVRSRTDLLREIYRLREPHVRRFFAPHYEPWDRDESIANSESERIESVTSLDGFVEILTTGDHFGYMERVRYRLRAEESSWSIASMERECGICHGFRYPRKCCM